MAAPAVAGSIVGKTGHTVALYRLVQRNVPRILSLYDIDVPVPTARSAVSRLFRENAHVRDERVVTKLIGRGELELEEALMQWKQRNHVMAILERPYEHGPQASGLGKSFEEKFYKNLVD